MLRILGGEMQSTMLHNPFPHCWLLKILIPCCCSKNLVIFVNTHRGTLLLSLGAREWWGKWDSACLDQSSHFLKLLFM